jgi:hypothetical protein
MCQQRNKQRSLNVPNARLELQQSPYNNFTQEQLDIRRKIEILKYSSNKISTQTNSATKREKWKQMVERSFQKRTYSQSVLEKIKNNLLECDINEIIPTPSTSSNIPGPLFYLKYDPNVPLYNYNNSINSYSFLPPIVPPPWSLYNNYDVTIINNNYFTISTIYIQNINSSTINFNMNVPIGIQLVLPTTPNIKNNGITITINITDIKLSFFYNDVIASAINLQKNINQNYTINVTNIINDNFMATFFLGMLNVTNANLQVSNKNVFDLKCNINYTIKGVLTNTNNVVYFNKSNLICNLTKNNLYLIDNGKIDFVSNKIYSPFLISQ